MATRYTACFENGHPYFEETFATVEELRRELTQYAGQDVFRVQIGAVEVDPDGRIIWLSFERLEAVNVDPIWLDHYRGASREG